MKKFQIMLLALIVLAQVGWSQYRVLDNMALFDQAKDTVGGINSTWTAGQGATVKGRVISNTITSVVPCPWPGGAMVPATRAWLEVSLIDTINAAGNGDVDSLIAIVQGVGAAGCTTAVFLDTLIFEWAGAAPKKNNTCIQEITPWLEYQISGVQTALGTGKVLPYQWRFFIAPEDSGNNFAFPYAGTIGDSIVINCRVILQADWNTGFTGAQ